MNGESSESGNPTIQSLRGEIARLEAELAAKRVELGRLESQETSEKVSRCNPGITQYSTPLEKVRLFGSLFHGREDVYARRFESAKTGKSGYQPVCANEWIPGVCEKPRIKCANCNHRQFQPFSEEVIRHHLMGKEPSERGTRPFVAGVYPLLPDETCWFLALDFDKEQWEQDASAFLATCKTEGVSAYLERSRSGNGGHIWIFFSEAFPARLARNLGSSLMTKTLDRRPELGLDSFDRFFPNQDTMPKGGLGNLIALPLQKKAREKNHSVFLDENRSPHADQWALLASVQRMERTTVEAYVQNSLLHKEVLPVAIEARDESEDDEPWKASRTAKWPVISDPLPQRVGVVLSNQIFVDSTGLPAILRNRILRLASFSNPEFYQAQAMRLSTWGKPRILYCYELFPKHIAIPIGCLDDLKALFDHYKITPELRDERNGGIRIEATFSGTLYPEQEAAAQALLDEETGVLSATTAFGKTVVALWLIAERKVNTLVLVHRKQLMDQWVERIGQFLGIPKKEVGRYGGGIHKRNGRLDVAVLQSVGHRGEVEEWVKEYGQIIVDECHHVSAFSFEQVVRSATAKYKHGLSATLTRKDGQHPIVFMNLGPVRYTVNARKQAAERSFDHRVKVRPTEFVSELAEPLSIQDLFKEVSGDEKRNQMIAADVLAAYQEHRQILVLSERTEHLAVLHVLLAASAENLFLLQGGMGRKQVKAVMESLVSLDHDQGVVILSTGRYLGEGFDLPNLDTLYLTFPVSWKGTLAQYAGRLHREYYGKTEVIIYDYLDASVPVLARMHGKRLKGYAAQGYDVHRQE